MEKGFTRETKGKALKMLGKRILMVWDLDIFGSKMMAEHGALRRGFHA